MLYLHNNESSLKALFNLTMAAMRLLGGSSNGPSTFSMASTKLLKMSLIPINVLMWTTLPSSLTTPWAVLLACDCGVATAKIAANATENCISICLKMYEDHSFYVRRLNLFWFTDGSIGLFIRNSHRFASYWCKYLWPTGPHALAPTPSAFEKQSHMYICFKSSYRMQN